MALSRPAHQRVTRAVGQPHRRIQGQTMQSLSSRYKDKLPQVGLVIILGLVLFAGNVASILYGARHIQKSALVSPLYAITTSTILTLWVHRDSRSRNTSMGIDQAMYFFLAWPITFPYYAFRSRGFRSGGLLLLLFVGIYVITFIAAIVIAMGITVGLSIFVAGQ